MPGPAWKLPPCAGLRSPLVLRVMYEPGVLEYVDAYPCGGDTFGELNCELGADWVAFCTGGAMIGFIGGGNECCWGCTCG